MEYTNVRDDQLWNIDEKEWWACVRPSGEIIGLARHEFLAQRMCRPHGSETVKRVLIAVYEGEES